MAANYKLTVIVALITVLVSCSTGKQRGELSADGLKTKLEAYVADKDARIGVAVIVDGMDTIAVNGTKDFPMMSVVKFPQAIALANSLGRRGMGLGDSVSFDQEALLEDTYSPMLEKYGKRAMTMTYDELLSWSLVESDNNACDIVFDCLGGVDSALVYLWQAVEPDDITIGATEADMHRDHYLSYLNRSTPLAMARLLSRFDREMRSSSESYAAIASMLERCSTGADRLAAPLMATNAVIGHKTGTGFVTPEGRLMALNDCGYVRLPDGRGYAIAVFIADAACDADAAAKMIADISEIVYLGLTR